MGYPKLVKKTACTDAETDRGFTRRRHRLRLYAVGLAIALTWVSGLGHAAEPLNPPIPLQAPGATLSSGTVAATLVAAERAQELGLPSVAINLYEELLASPGFDRGSLTYPLASALLDAGRAADAEHLLQTAPGPHGNEWRLRLGLAAAQQKKLDQAAEQANHINVDQLNRPDRAWFWFLLGELANAAKDQSKADQNYNLAQKEAASDMAVATIHTAGVRAQLGVVNYTAVDLEQLRTEYEIEQRKGRAAYDQALNYAIARSATGGRAEAVRFLTDLLARIPRSERSAADKFRRLLGLIGDRTRGGAGRTALNQLLESGSDPNYQRQALQILGQDSQFEPERGIFRAELDKVIAMTPKSAVLDSVLLMRAQIALGDSPKDYVTAERRTNELNQSFPGSQLRPQAFVVLATSAWEQKRYRVAADMARQARETLAASPAATSPTETKVIAQQVAELRVFEAEARYRAADYRLAADAYAAAVREPPSGTNPGDLMFQRALASILADRDDPTKDMAKVVDELEMDPHFDARNRWEAEWSLARGLTVQGKTQAAFDRVTKLLLASDAGAAGITPELRAKMSWLRVRLSFLSGHPDTTLDLVPKLSSVTVALNPELREEIGSTAILLKARAEFELDREQDGLETLNSLRAEFPKSDAAIYSYLVAANHYAEPGRDQIQKAQNSLRKLIDNPNYQSSEYVPYALFQLALLSERLGQEKDLREADHLIEDLVQPNRKAPPELVFAARLKQGDLLRTLNDFARAQVAYEDLVNNPKYAQRPDVLVAQLRLAECHNAQSATDPSGSHMDLAQSMFEELLYRVAAPSDVRVEAGYNFGKLLERRGQPDKAHDVWWRDVIQPFLIDPKPGTLRRATEPYWLARTLVDLGTLLEQRGNNDEARRVYALLRDSKLGYGESAAIEGLRRLGVAAAK